MRWAFRLPSPRERSEWRGPAFAKATAGKGACPAEARRAKGDGGSRLLGARLIGACRRFGASVVPPPLAPQLRCVARPSPPTGGRVATVPWCLGRVACAPSLLLRRRLLLLAHRRHDVLGHLARDAQV